MNANIFSTGGISQPSSSTGWSFGDLLSFTRDAGKSFFEYDLQKDLLKQQRAQQAAGYNSGYGTPNSYDYTRFADDGGILGGASGLRGAQTFLLIMAAIAAYALVNKK